MQRKKEILNAAHKALEYGEVHMERWIDALSLILKIFTLYTAITGLFFLLPQKKYKRCPPKTRFAVLIAARNEEAVIGHTVTQFLKQTYPSDLYDLYIIPNNCTDDTAGVARRAGAKVLPCTVPVRTKGQVLQWAFQTLEPMAYDAYCIFDADNLVDPDFLSRMNDAFCAGARLAKGLQKASNPGETWISGCYDLYVENFNLLYSRPRGTLGLSAKLIGTGFAVSRDLLNEMGGFQTVTLTEDTEFAVQCGLRGEKVWWVPEAVTYDEEPLTFHVSMVQRRRWSSGVMQTAQVYIPRLLKAIFTGRHPLLCLDLAVLISGPMFQVLALIPGLYLIWQTLAAGNWLYLVYSIVSFWAGMMGTALLLAVLGKRPVFKMWKTILLYPLFTASWYPLHILAVFKKAKVWKPIAHQGSRPLPQLSSDKAAC